MAQAQQHTVKETGAGFGDYLEGAEPHNKGLIVHIFSDQMIGEGGRLQGEMQIVSAGDGDYAKEIEPLVGRAPMTADDIITFVLERAPKASYFLNANTLRIKAR